MIHGVLLVTGLSAATYGGWRGYVAARSALVLFVRQGDQTRALIDGARPILSRTRIRIAARNVAFAIGWLTVSMYGLFLATVGAGLDR